MPAEPPGPLPTGARRLMPGLPARPLRRWFRRLAPAFVLSLSVSATAAEPSLTPWADASPEFAEALRHARANRTDAAVAAIERLRSRPGDADVPPPAALDYVLGRILEESGRSEAALARFEAAAASPLGDSARFRAGRLLLARGDVAAARAAFGGISPGSDSFVEGRLLLADVLVREARFEAARVVADDLLQDDLPPAARLGARLARVAALAAAGERERARVEAFLAWLHAPDASGTARAARVLASLDAAPGPAHAWLRDVIQARGQSLQRLAKQARRSPSRLAKIDPGLPALIEGVAARSKRPSRDRAVTLLEQAVARAVNPEVRDYAVFSLGRALVLVDREDEASTAFLSLWDVPVRGPFAAEAGFEAARSATRLKQGERATALLEQVATEHPEGAFAARIRWELVLAELVAGNDAGALARIDGALARLDRGGGLVFGSVERLRYFRGVVLARLGHDDAAGRDLRRVARGDPWSYYGVMAASRLGNGTSGGVVVDADATGGGLSPEAIGPVWLWRLGYREEARAQLAARARLGVLDAPAVRILARMNGRRRHAPSQRDLLRGPIEAADAVRFQEHHPRPFLEEVDKAARATGVDPALIYAVMRVESGFAPRARSPAGAIGLMQVLRATARRVAAVSLGNRGLANALGRPSANVLIGSALLRELDGLFRGHLPLMLAGYHAGSGAARRFHRHFGHLPTDVFVEMLPYAQTTRYIRRVLGLAAGYRALYDDADRGPLRLPDSLPETLGPFLQRPIVVPGA